MERMNVLNFEDQLRAVVEELKNTVLERTDEMNNKLEHLLNKVGSMERELDELGKTVESTRQLASKVNDRLRWG